MILDQQDQQHQSLIGTVWSKTVEIGEVLFLIGAVLIVVHFFVGVAALVCTLGKLYTPPPWLWIELKVLVYPLAPIMWLRLLFVASAHNLRPSQKKYYAYIFAIGLGAFILALNLFAWYSNFAFPLLTIAYASQFVLDARLPGKRKKRKHQHTRSEPRTPTASQAKSRLHVRQKQEQVAFSPQGAVESFKQSMFAKRYASVPLTQRVGIWYSPADAKFAAKLRTHLQPKIRQGVIDLWDADQILPGALWREERTRAVQSAGVAVVLVSADLMASELIARDELPQLLFRAMTQGTIILLLHVSPCNFEGSGLERFHPVNSPDKPLAKLERSDRDRVLAQAAHAICQRLGLSL